MSPKHPTLEETEELIRVQFAGKVDRSGDPFFNHMKRVVGDLDGFSEIVLHSAWLHDLIEDTPMTLEDLRFFGYSEEIITAVDLLTHRKKEMKYPEYIDKICASGNLTAIVVKYADQTDNKNFRRWMKLDVYVRNALEKKYAGVQQKLVAAMGKYFDENPNAC